MTQSLPGHTFEARYSVNEEPMVAATLLPLILTTAVSGQAPEWLPRLEEALVRFEEAGLALPESLEIRIGNSHCRRSTATVRPPWTVTYCLGTIHDTYWEHELAHVWVECHLTDEDRKDFIANWNLPTWHADGETPWQWHGTERAAVAIERYVSGYSVIGESWPWTEYAHWLLDRALENTSQPGSEVACSQPDGRGELPHRWHPHEAITASAGRRMGKHLRRAARRTPTDLKRSALPVGRRPQAHPAQEERRSGRDCLAS